MYVLKVSRVKKALKCSSLFIAETLCECISQFSRLYKKNMHVFLLFPLGFFFYPSNYLIQNIPGFGMILYPSPFQLEVQVT